MTKRVRHGSGQKPKIACPERRAVGTEKTEILIDVTIRYAYTPKPRTANGKQNC